VSESGSVGTAGGRCKSVPIRRERAGQDAFETLLSGEEDYVVFARMALRRGGTVQSRRHIIVAIAFCHGAPPSSSVLVEVSELPGATNRIATDIPRTKRTGEASGTRSCIQAMIKRWLRKLATA